MEIHNRKYLKERRKELRSQLTSAEAYLWTFLQKSQLEGKKFRRQHSIKNFIVDFYCPKEKLVIELDGEFHFNSFSASQDNQRQNTIESLGITVIRFENKEVFENIELVLEEIKCHFK